MGDDAPSRLDRSGRRGIGDAGTAPCFAQSDLAIGMLASAAPLDTGLRVVIIIRIGQRQSGNIRVGRVTVGSSEGFLPSALLILDPLATCGVAFG
jgi:hypothetical protein